MKNLYAIGDVHGCYNTLRRLLAQIFADNGDNHAKIVFLGDYTDRGPASFEVMQFLIDLQLSDANPKIEYVFLLGNHDQMLIDAITSSDPYWDRGVLTSYHNAGYEPREHIDFLKSLNHWHVDGDFLFVHANANPNWKSVDDIGNDFGKDVAIWCRDFNDYNEEFFDNKFVIHGHTPATVPKINTNQICIDTGCCFNQYYSDEGFKYLTAVKLSGRDSYKFLKEEYCE